MEEYSYQKNLLTSAVLQDALDRQIDLIYNNQRSKAQLVYNLLNKNGKKREFEIINECINAVKHNIANGNYRSAFNFLVILKKEIEKFNKNIM